MNIPILMYHEIIDEGSDNTALFGTMHRPYFVSKTAFESQLEFLRKEGFQSISLNDMVNLINDPSGPRPPDRSVILTFDDGFAGNYAHAFPLLKKYGMKAVVFAAAGLIGRKNMMDWGQLREMSRAGISIQSHTMSHSFLKQLPHDRVTGELRDSKSLIEKEVGAKVEFLSLPHGSYGRGYREAAKNAGYLAGCCSKIGYNNEKTDPYFLRRILVSGGYGIKEFGKIVENRGIFVPVLRLKKEVKTAVRNIIGENIYMRLYRAVFGLGRNS
jgi:peptidoglycan/xylan/chitin deacetylase (PgdA/CDA1 family)